MHDSTGRATAKLDVREAEALDAHEIAHVHQLSRSWYYGIRVDAEGETRAAMWSKLLAQPTRATYVAEDEDQIVGFISFTRTDDQPDQLELTSLYVLPGHFGSGIGRTLYAQFDSARRPGEPGRLEVWAGNTRAKSFYRRCGWNETDLTRPGPQNQPFVTWTLASYTAPSGQ